LSQLTSDSPLKRYLAEVHRGCQQGALLTQRLRLFARRSSPGAHMGMLSAAVAEQRARLANWSRDIDFRLEAADGLPPVALAPDQLHELLAPLLDNACEASAGKGRVTLTARPVRLEQQECLELWGSAAPGPYVRVDICDTGDGLSAEARARLFREPFYTSKPRHRGLGLVIAYGILRSNRGGLRLEDNPGGGVTASVYLPTATPAAESAGPVSPTARRRTLEQPLLSAAERAAQ
jgi:signal transduction histidine kinase